MSHKRRTWIHRCLSFIICSLRLWLYDGKLGSKLGMQIPSLSKASHHLTRTTQS